MKKVIIFLAIIIVLFSTVAILTNIQNSQQAANNPYNKSSLHPETIRQLEDPNYQNLILPQELNEKLNNKEDVTVYFYSPTCQYCQQTTPIVSPLSEEMDIDLVQFNLLEFENGFDDFHIESTPTIVQYKAGKESARIVGYQEEDTFRQWFNENSK
ncbi:thioredoxin family protein [Bacillaceae bacterium Marseille-Q3522]|nr:thioredoxin family protein [Bacillaceae bacterium Marseille-Q3522]